MKYRFPLYLKFLLGYLVFAGISIWFVNYYAASLITDRLVAQKAAEMYKQTKTITSYYQNSPAGTSQEENLEDILKMLRVYNAATNASLYLINARGDLVLSSEWTALPDPESEEPLTHTDFDAALFDKGYYLRGGMLSDLTGEKDSITVFSTLTGSYHITGYIVMSMPMSVVLPESYYLQRIVYVTVAIVIVLSLIILAVFTVVVFLPLKKITNAANEYADGNFSYRATVKSHDEMGYLAATLGYMAEEIEEAGEGQRQLVANISHDFRSPLTSVKGYLEALLDGTIPPEMSEKYIRIVLDEADRLHKLTQNLLELNTSGSKGTYLSCTMFDVNHLIRKIALSFEGVCVRRGIHFELVFTNRSQMVYADSEKINRVLYNLIDNAIKFSPDKGTITIETFEKNDKAFISVKDEGIGIEKDDLNKIWNRFYKTDTSRGKDKKGTGLGLAIAKDIIQSHNESIDVVSTPGVGTKFTFRLPLGNGKKS